MSASCPFECCLCLSLYNSKKHRPTTFPCGHSVCLRHVPHLSCCPFCRAEIPSSEQCLPSVALQEAANLFKRANKKKRKGCSGAQCLVQNPNVKVHVQVCGRVSPPCRGGEMAWEEHLRGSCPKSVNEWSEIVPHQSSCSCGPSSSSLHVSLVVGIEPFKCVHCSHPFDADEFVPTTLRCGHSVCLKHTSTLSFCDVCAAPVSQSLEFQPNITLRDAATHFLVVDGSWRTVRPTVVQLSRSMSAVHMEPLEHLEAGKLSCRALSSGALQSTAHSPKVPVLSAPVKRSPLAEAHHFTTVGFNPLVAEFYSEHRQPAAELLPVGTSIHSIRSELSRPFCMNASESIAQPVSPAATRRTPNALHRLVGGCFPFFRCLRSAGTQ
eukprot:RCo004200